MSIVCTQPRRVAAISVAERVATERAERLGDSVGYQACCFCIGLSTIIIWTGTGSGTVYRGRVFHCRKPNSTMVEFGTDQTDPDCCQISFKFLKMFPFNFFITFIV